MTKFDFNAMEYAVLGTCIKDQLFRYQTFEFLNANHFEIPNCVSLYLAMKEMSKKGNEINFPSVTAFYATFMGISVQDSLFHTEACEQHASYLRCDDYIEALKERYVRKQLTKLSMELSFSAQDYERDVQDLIQNIKTTIASLSLDSSKTILTPSESLKNHLNGKSFQEVITSRIRAFKEGIQDLPGIPYNIPTLDAMTKGIRPGSLVLLGGRTSMGKTEMALNFARTWLNAGVSVGIFSMEMPLYQLDTRLIAQKACLNVDDLESGDLTNEQGFRILECAKWLEKTKLCYDQTSGLKPSQLKARIYYMQQRFQTKIIIVDFLTLMKGDMKTNSAHERFTHVVQEIQNMAKEFNIAIMLIAQLSREAAKEVRTPKLTDIRESGAIEEAIDVALFVHRRDYYDRLDKPGLVELVVAKNRHTGKVGSIFLAKASDSCTFVETEQNNQEEEKEIEPSPLASLEDFNKYKRKNGF